MRWEAKTLLFVTAALWIIGGVVWPGCATAPLPPKRRPFDSRKVQDFQFLRAGQISRTEMIANLGEPDAYFEDLKVACYRINQIGARRLWLFLGILPVSVSESPGGIEVAFIQFDDRGHAQRFGIGTGREHLRALATDWLAGKIKERRLR